MQTKNKSIQLLLTKYHEISLLDKIKAALEWDLNVNMPSKGVEGRSQQSTLLTELMTDLWLKPELKNTLLELQGTQLTEDEQAVVRNMYRLGKYYFRVPKKIILEKSEITTKAFVAWHEAKQKNDFKIFRPYLEKIVSLEREIASFLEYKDNPYDALLDLYEPDLNVKFLDSIFTPLRNELSQFIIKIKESKKYQDKSSFNGRYSPKMQQKLGAYILDLMQYSNAEGRLDTSPHPFTTTLDRFDVRITTKYLENDYRSSYASIIHEAGHALYELGVNPHYSYTPLEGGVSLGIHESQSRFWENQVGRNPLFLKFLFPIFKTLFHEDEMTYESLVHGLNEVKPGFIRIEADEVTYNLHIILRYEIERDIINNSIKVDDIPEYWRDKMQSLFGITPSTDAEGALQDIHWSGGSFGYFPTYSLGNLYAAQFTHTLKKELSFDDLLASGELGPIVEWLRKNIHTYGSLYYPHELVQRVTGEDLNSKYFVQYIKDKYSSLYQLK